MTLTMKAKISSNFLSFEEIFVFAGFGGGLNPRLKSRGEFYFREKRCSSPLRQGGAMIKSPGARNCWGSGSWG